MATAKLHQTISVRTTWVTSTKNADRTKKVGWQAHCENCSSDQFYPLDQHDRALLFALTHKCYAKKEGTKPTPKKKNLHHNEKLRSGSDGRISR